MGAGDRRVYAVGSPDLGTSQLQTCRHHHGRNCTGLIRKTPSSRSSIHFNLASSPPPAAASFDYLLVSFYASPSFFIPFPFPSREIAFRSSRSDSRCTRTCRLPESGDKLSPARAHCSPHSSFAFAFALSDKLRFVFRRRRRPSRNSRSWTASSAHQRERDTT